MKTTRLVLAALAMTLALTACSGGASDSDSGADSAGQTSADQPSSADDGRSFGGAATERAASPDTASLKQTDQAKEPLNRAVISNGTVSLTADDVRTARQDVQRVLDSEGAMVSEEEAHSNDDGELSYTRLVVRVSAKDFAATMASLEKVATLSASNRSSEDVTTQVIDNDVRVRAQEASLKRVETLLARADSLKDIIWIESQLTQRQAELDSLKSQQAWLTDQTTLSTVTVDITAQADAPKKEEDEKAGFLTGLKGGWSALSGTATALATVAGALLPFAFVALLLGGPLWLLVRRARSRRTSPAAEA